MTQRPKCPHCNYEFDDEETWNSSYSKESQVHTGDFEDSEVKCHSCEEIFKVTCEHIFTFKSEVIEVDNWVEINIK